MQVLEARERVEKKRRDVPQALSKALSEAMQSSRSELQTRDEFQQGAKIPELQPINLPDPQQLQAQLEGVIHAAPSMRYSWSFQEILRFCRWMQPVIRVGISMHNIYICSIRDMVTYPTRYV